MISECKTKYIEKAISGQKFDGVVYFSKPIQSTECGTKCWNFSNRPNCYEFKF